MNFSGLKSHKEIFSRCIKELEKDTKIKAVLLSGSFVYGKPDYFSDIDLNILVEDKFIDSVYREKDKIISRVSTVASKFPATHLPLPNRLYVVFFEYNNDIVKVDFDFESISDFNGFDKKREVIFDRTNMLKKKFGKIDGKRQSLTKDELLDLNAKFWGWVWYSFGKIMRGEYFEAFDGIYCVRKLIINRLVLDMTESKDEGWRRIEEKYTKKLLDQFKATHSDISKESLLKSLLATITLYKNIRKDAEKKYRVRLNNADEEFISGKVKDMS